MLNISYAVHTFKEANSDVAYVAELDVSRRGATLEEARKNIRDAVQAFLDVSAEMGTVKEILEEGGYTRQGDVWNPPEFVSFDRAVASIR